MPPTGKTATPAKAAPKPAPVAPAAETAEETPKRQKYSELPQAEKDALAQEEIAKLYNMEGTDEEAQKAKRGIRAKLRNIDPNWRETYGDYIRENWPPASGEVEQEAPAAAPVKAAPVKPAAAPVKKVAAKK